jgi:hypothetical protein
LAHHLPGSQNVTRKEAAGQFTIATLKRLKNRAMFVH